MQDLTVKLNWNSYNFIKITFVLSCINILSLKNTALYGDIFIENIGLFRIIFYICKR